MKRSTDIYRGLVGLFVVGLIGCTDLELDPAAAPSDAGPDGAAGMSGGSGMSGSSADGGSIEPPEAVEPRTSGFSTLGQPRSGGGFTLRDDGFESGARRCTATGAFCVTGGFEP
jgi:hypothetical protein